jgi:hypothetical protein
MLWPLYGSWAMYAARRGSRVRCRDLMHRLCACADVRIPLVLVEAVMSNVLLVHVLGTLRVQHRGHAPVREVHRCHSSPDQHGHSGSLQAMGKHAGDNPEAPLSLSANLIQTMHIDIFRMATSATKLSIGRGCPASQSGNTTKNASLLSRTAQKMATRSSEMHWSLLGRTNVCGRRGNVVQIA